MNITNKPIRKVSVIMGIYNCASTLAEALDSLLAQTYQDFKVIMCDDGSTDDTYMIAKKYVECHDNFLLIQNERNIGLNATLNRCLDFVDTPYVARMDGDDISLPDRFAVQVEFLDSHPEYAFVSGEMICFDEKGDFRHISVKEHPSILDFIPNTPFLHAPVMVRTDAYRKVGGYTIDKRLLRVEDYHLWFKLYAKGYIGYNLQQPLYKMRDDRNALSRRNLRNRYNETYVKIIGYKMLRIPKRYYIYTIVPLLKWACPTPLYRYFHSK